MEIVPLAKAQLSAVKIFSDKVIGENYFTLNQLQDILSRSLKDEVSASLVLQDEGGQVRGIRLSYPHGNWLDLKSEEQVHPNLWNVSQDNVAYFQSLFLDAEIRGQGWGKKLSLASMDVLRTVGSRAIVCHSWKESPHNSSMKYLLSLGFKPLIEIPNYWIDVDYDCVRCGKPCLCTATEMVFYL